MVSAVMAYMECGGPRLPEFFGVASANWRMGEDVCTAVARHSGGNTSLAVVYAVSQLEAIQQLCFPDFPLDVGRIQGVARLPRENARKPFCVRGQLAEIGIFGLATVQALTVYS
jgi:hypothetical protein